MDASRAEPAGPRFGPEQLLEHAEFLRRLARGLVRDEQRAADLVQETLLTALERPPRDPSGLRAWLVSVLRNGAINSVRGRARREARERRAARPERVERAPDEALAGLELQRLVVEQLLALPAEQRGALYLRYYEGLPPREIAARTGAPVKTVKTRLARGLEGLRGRLDGRVDGGRGAWTAALLPLARAPLSVPSDAHGGPVSAADRAAPAGGTAVTGVLGGLLVSKLAAVGIAVLALGAAWLALGGEGIVSRNGGAAGPAAPEGLVAPSPVAEASEPVDPAPIASAPRTSAEATVAAEPKEREPAPSTGLAVELRWHDGTPAAGVIAYFTSWDDRAPRQREFERTADESGHLRFQGLPPGRGQLTVDRGFAERVELTEGETTSLDWTLPRGLDVQGVVLDPEGVPVAEAELWLRRSWLWPGGARVGLSGADGTFALSCLHPQIGLGARSPGVLPSPWLAPEVLPAGQAGLESRTAELWLGAAGSSLAGFVLAPDGHPVCGALVHAGWPGGHDVRDRSGLTATAATPLPVATDSEGRFTIPGALEAKQVPVHVQAEGFPAWAGTADLRAGDVDDLEVRLGLPAVVVGRVVDLDGRPVPEATVVCGRQRDGGWYEHAFPPIEVHTDADGSFRMELLPAGRQELNVHPQRARLGRARAEVDCTPGETTEIELRLDPNPVIAGRVVDRHGGPLPDWRVEVVPVDYGSWHPRTDMSDATGGFLLANVGEMPNQVSVSRPGSWSRVSTVAASAGQRDLVIVVSDDESRTGSLRGVVLDEHGDAPVGARLARVSEEDPLRGQFVEVDLRTGAFEAQDVLTGRHRLRLTVGGLSRTVLATDWFTVEEGLTTDLGELRVEAPGRVEVLLPTLDGRTLDLEEFEACLPLLDGTGTEWEALSAEGDRLVSGPVMPGTWRLRCNGNVHVVRDEVIVTSGRTTVVTPVLEHARHVRFELSFAEGEWLDVTLTALDGEGRTLRQNRWSRAVLDTTTAPTLSLKLPLGPAHVEARTDTGLTASALVEVGPGRPVAPVPLRLAR